MLTDIDATDLMNATICISILSIALASVYAGSRVLAALAETGFAPRCFAMVDKAGRPLWSVVFNLAWGAVSTLCLRSQGDSSLTAASALADCLRFPR